MSRTIDYPSAIYVLKDSDFNDKELKIRERHKQKELAGEFYSGVPRGRFVSSLEHLPNVTTDPQPSSGKQHYKTAIAYMTMPHLHQRSASILVNDRTVWK